jgi:hypothetical protein
MEVVVGVKIYWSRRDDGAKWGGGGSVKEKESVAQA